MPAPIRILIVEDSALVRNGIRAVVATATNPAIEVVAEAATNAEAISACDQHRPDVVLLDIRLPDGTGFETCRSMLERHPRTRVLILTSHSTDTFVYEAVAAGAHGYLMKEIDPAGLVQAIIDVASGQSILAPDVTERVLKLMRSGGGAGASDDLAILSPQENRVLALVAEGLTNKEVGARLNLSENTVKNYLINVFEKLHVRRRAQAAAIYVQNTEAQGHPATRGSNTPFRRRGGFSLVEVMMASIVMVLGITTAITTLQRGLLAVDSARNYSYAAQVMQSELERLRLKSWSQLQSLQDAGETVVSTDDTQTSARTVFTCKRVISDLKSGMKEITLISNWQGFDGRPHTARFITRYSKTGLYDYYYTAH
ncbi:MAG: response regulator [Opitutaceae bacterium]|nr:response regulator [Cephaloticoccus sp.]MCP5529674.1 response regulator [Opitutaceae bacterium]